MRSLRLRSASLALLPLLLVACGEEPQGSSAPAQPSQTVAEDETNLPALLEPEVPVEPVVDVDAAAPKPLDEREEREKTERWREEMDAYARGLVASFESRVFDPVRDGELRFAEGVAVVRAAEAEGSYRITFDGTRPLGQRVRIAAEGDADEVLPRGSLKQVSKFADLALNGPYRFVVQYYPPVQLLLTYSKDRKHKIVTAPPHKHDVQASYRFDDRELISHRGISVRPAAEVTNYEWTFWHGRYLLSRLWLRGTAGACELEYDDRESRGVVLLKRALLQRGEKTFDTSFTWERVEVGEPVALPDDER